MICGLRQYLLVQAMAPVTTAVHGDHGASVGLHGDVTIDHAICRIAPPWIETEIAEARISSAERVHYQTFFCGEELGTLVRAITTKQTEKDRAYGIGNQ